MINIYVSIASVVMIVLGGMQYRYMSLETQLEQAYIDCNATVKAVTGKLKKKSTLLEEQKVLTEECSGKIGSMSSTAIVDYILTKDIKVVLNEKNKDDSNFSTGSYEY